MLTAFLIIFPRCGFVMYKTVFNVLRAHKNKKLITYVKVYYTLDVTRGKIILCIKLVLNLLVLKRRKLCVFLYIFIKNNTKIKAFAIKIAENK